MKVIPVQILAISLLLPVALCAQQAKRYRIASPDNKIAITVAVDQGIRWSVKHENTSVLAPSAVSVTMSGGVLGGSTALATGAKTTSVNTTFATPLYKKKQVADQYNQLILNCRGNYGMVFRAYNDGVAYRFFTNRKDSLTITGEQAEFNFDKDYKTLIPLVRDLRVPGDQFVTSFEALYDELNVSKIPADTLGFLPMLVALDEGKKAVILEADLEEYPGMYLSGNPQAPNSLHGVFAPYPAEEKTGGYHNINYVVSKRAGYMARTAGTRSFPWRVLVISATDKELANSDMVQKLAAPSRVSDVSWIRPGKVAWDWWNNWNITHVDFRAGVNTPTYKYYIDFAAANNIEYIVMDEGWSSDENLLKISPHINLEEIIAYGKQKNVDVILWASWYALTRSMDDVFAKYAKMGVKGFKIDFLDRDDQKMVASTYEIARKAAGYKLLIDFHGMFKPAGLQRTFPNVINFEGVKGLENVKWTPGDDVPGYDVTIPFIRMLAGPMDYTPGAMRNATKSDFRPSNALPMSQGTRCHQLAMYVVFEAPLQMLADNPTAYMQEQESTSFIAKVPTTFDETLALDGKVGEYVAIARKKADTWFVGALNNWTAREFTLDLFFLKNGRYEAEIFRDGVNADRNATDYTREVVPLSGNSPLTIRLSAGGGWAARIYPVK